MVECHSESFPRVNAGATREAAGLTTRAMGAEHLMASRCKLAARLVINRGQSSDN